MERVLDDRAARFEAMFARHAGRVYAYAARRSDPDTAGEAVGETFLVAWRRLEAIPDDPLPWLINVASKVLANRRRSAQRRAAFLVAQADRERRAPVADPAEVVSTAVTVRDALTRLTPREREAITLVAWDGLDVREGAIAAGCSRATFSVRLHRARRHLMKELAMERHPWSTARGTGDVPTEEATST